VLQFEHTQVPTALNLSAGFCEGHAAHPVPLRILYSGKARHDLAREKMHGFPRVGQVDHAEIHLQRSRLEAANFGVVSGDRLANSEAYRVQVVPFLFNGESSYRWCRS
jgi:hypothetical protein